MMRHTKTPRISPRLQFPLSRRFDKPELPRLPKRADIILQRLAWSSQIALVFAGILGYVYTVRPVHQKQLLDEQIAERTISLKAATVTLEKLQFEAARLRTKNSKLETEAKETYEQLRSKLSLELISIPNTCAVRLNNSPRDSRDVPACVIKFSKERIAPGLRPEDRAILFAVIEHHSQQMIRSSANVTKQFAAKARQLDKDLQKAKSDLKNSDSEIRAEILRLRIARAGGKAVEPDSTTGSITIRADEDQRAYNKYVTRKDDLVYLVTKLSQDKIFFNVDFESAYRDALAKPTSQILDEFQKNTRKP